ncbi:RNA-binding protein [uncultured Microbacterium sp.]|uniref:RNA-binding protein n=1 Tax=uncultured Microbacterium sp. TaxID=191216 RepID=UPI00260FCBB1|nr:RNA-binding protein [uncultured Microbacterium sp.]
MTDRTGLRFPADLSAWQRWQRGRHVVRRVRDVLRATAAPGPLVLHRPAQGQDPLVLFALDATTPTAIASVLEPLAHLEHVPVGVLASADVSARLPGAWRVDRGDPGTAPATLRGVRAVVSAGHFLPVGDAAFRWAQAHGWRYVVVQHGLLTPFMPPLPPAAHLLAFTERDAAFWASGRADVTHEVVGSQLLWRAAQHGSAAKASSVPPVFLGQLHGAELSRRTSAATALTFCRETGALYRPHPAESDRLSRWQHARWQRRGIRFDAPGPLNASSGPVVSIFSTGVLEAAASGRDAWVTCVRPPDWVRAFWERYELSPWGQSATAHPTRPAIEPARAIADAVVALASAPRTEGR